MCHGYGSDENDLFSFASELPEELFVISVRAPYPLQPYGNAWYAIHFDTDDGKWSDDEQAKTSVKAIVEFIDYAVKTYPVNTNNVTLLGFSQGTILSYAVALNHPKKVKNVIALSGYINNALLPESIDKNTFKHLAIFASHGSVDQVIPVDWARKAPEFLKELHMNHVYKEYPVGHGVAPQNFYDFKAWLVEHI
jgi:phospholipase/carboxylesterase